MRIGATLPGRGTHPAALGVGVMGRQLEDAGFDSVWVSDHTVMPVEVKSRYPFAADGHPGWDLDDPWYDAIVLMSMLVEGTTRIHVGVAVLILPLRNPFILAKQIAALDVLSRGRVALGVGSGWLKEEFDILGVNFENRGRQVEDAVEILRHCWQGKAARFSGTQYELPAGARFFPRPTRDIPILVGGMSPVALRRAGRIGTGWLGTTTTRRLRGEALSLIPKVMWAAENSGRTTDDVEIVLRIGADGDRYIDEVCDSMPLIVASGVTEIILEVPWDDEPDLNEWQSRVREAAIGA